MGIFIVLNTLNHADLCLRVAENHRRGVYLQMTLDGRVLGSEAQTPYSEYLEDKSVTHMWAKSRL